MDNPAAIKRSRLQAKREEVKERYAKEAASKQEIDNAPPRGDVLNNVEDKQRDEVEQMRGPLPRVVRSNYGFLRNDEATLRKREDAELFQSVAFINQETEATRMAVKLFENRHPDVKAHYKEFQSGLYDRCLAKAMEDLTRTYPLISKEKINRAAHDMAAASSRAAMIELYRKEEPGDFVFQHVHDKA